MKIALVGNGYWGSKLLRNLVTLVGPERVVVADPSEAARKFDAFPESDSCRAAFHLGRRG